MQIFRFKNLSSVPNLVHGVSTKAFGSMKNNNRINYGNINKFLKYLNIDHDQLVLPGQIHSAVVKEVIFPNPQKVIQNTDALFAKKDNIFLGLLTADCLPILIYDKNKHIVATVHAGYQGLAKLIIKKTISKLTALGSDPIDFLVGIGPAVGGCCYNIDKDRLLLFKNIFPSYKDYYYELSGEYFIDLKKLAIHNLIEHGVKRENIEISKICTYDNVDNFFSFRKDQSITGRFISVIGLNKN